MYMCMYTCVCVHVYMHMCVNGIYFYELSANKSTCFPVLNHVTPQRQTSLLMHSIHGIKS